MPAEGPDEKPQPVSLIFHLVFNYDYFMHVSNSGKHLTRILAEIFFTKGRSRGMRG